MIIWFYLFLYFFLSLVSFCLPQLGMRKNKLGFGICTKVWCEWWHWGHLQAGCHMSWEQQLQPRHICFWHAPCYTIFIPIFFSTKFSPGAHSSLNWVFFSHFESCCLVSALFGTNFSIKFSKTNRPITYSKATTSRLVLPSS